MIPNQWYAVLETYEVKPGKPVGVTRLGEKMVFWRMASGQVACAADLCPHRGAALSLGKVKGEHIECPFHGFQYDSSGRCQLIPANGRSAPVPKIMQVRAYPVREAHKFIWVWWGEPQESYPPLPYFDDLDNGFSYASYQETWPVHYTRAIENQLDVFHLPFPHYNTIGRGSRTVSNGPRVTLQDDRMDIWVYNQVDDGTIARRVSDLPEPARPPMLRFNFPNLWMNRISDDMRIVVSFVPIDECSTRMYLRYYQRFIRLPVLRDLVNQITSLSSTIILHQDRRVVATQRPIWSDVKMGEKLIPQDRPIILYRQRRRELIDQAAATPEN